MYAHICTFIATKPSSNSDWLIRSGEKWKLLLILNACQTHETTILACAYIYIRTYVYTYLSFTATFSQKTVKYLFFDINFSTKFFDNNSKIHIYLLIF